MYLRWLILGQAGFVAAMALVIMLYYLTARSVRHRNLARWHVVLIALSYLVLTIDHTTDVAARIRADDPWTWHLPLGFVAYLLGNVALVVVMLSVRRTYLRENQTKP